VVVATSLPSIVRLSLATFWLSSVADAEMVCLGTDTVSGHWGLMLVITGAVVSLPSVTETAEEVPTLPAAS
jgi:hypothetical protein